MRQMPRKILLIPSALLICPWLVGCGLYRRDPSALQKQIASAVPLHSSPEQVLDYLDREKIVHSKYHVGENKAKVIEAEVFVKTKHSIVQPTYEVAFQFGKDDRLTSYDVYYLGYIGF